MSYVQQVGAKKLWAVQDFAADPEPWAYISQVGDTYSVEDVKDGPLGSRRTLAEAVALADRHARQENGS